LCYCAYNFSCSTRTASLSVYPELVQILTSMSSFWAIGNSLMNHGNPTLVQQLLLEWTQPAPSHNGSSVNIFKSSSVTRLTIIMLTYKWRRSWTRDSSTWAIIVRVIFIITQSCSISPHMLARVANGDRYTINICNIDASASSLLESICRIFLVSSQFTTYLTIAYTILQKKL